jgi:DNA uptake protein ComE-like DNA-binding protein
LIFVISAFSETLAFFSTSLTIYVDVKGAVKLPDVYEMKKNDRVKDVLKKAKVSEN